MQTQTDRERKGRSDRRLIVDSSVAMIIDILRELGREVLADRAAQESSAVQNPSANSGISGTQQSESLQP